MGGKIHRHQAMKKNTGLRNPRADERGDTFPITLVITDADRAATREVRVEPILDQEKIIANPAAKSPQHRDATPVTRGGRPRDRETFPLQKKSASV
ncbi:MAG: hypothetical protein A2X94_02390 [Bdellovibrionales bacterium GWB1_55_8]|nr:MAG: hypothetical protein A2X94_02390 [Bdellovibrionales bacterium GWB1_55_8]